KLCVIGEAGELMRRLFKFVGKRGGGKIPAEQVRQNIQSFQFGCQQRRKFLAKPSGATSHEQVSNAQQTLAEEQKWIEWNVPKMQVANVCKLDFPAHLKEVISGKREALPSWRRKGLNPMSSRSAVIVKDCFGSNTTKAV
ncbi:MAG TPA: hypothetical protein PK988_12985, partial [Candidatus Sumerlaeota bacterium]|nr:hypothetical protein [Candidatus Sumerlaeota bacterium]